jgi:hypothetical protein
MKDDLINGTLAVGAHAAAILWATENGFAYLTSVALPVILFLLGKLIDFGVRLYFERRAERKRIFTGKQKIKAES